MTERKRKHRFKAEPVGVVDPTPNRSQEFAATDDERLLTRAHLRTQQALLGKINPRSAYTCVFGAALLCVEAGIEASKAYDAFKAEYERVSEEFDKLGLGPVKRLVAEVGLVKENKQHDYRPPQGEAGGQVSTDERLVPRARPAKRQYLGQHKCVACPTMVRVYDWLPSMLLCAKCARQESRNDRHGSEVKE